MKFVVSFTTNDVNITTKEGLKHVGVAKYEIKKKIVNLFFYPPRGRLLCERALQSD
jgi:hypothetical protein